MHSHLITFDNIGTTGDCMGDGIRGQGKDVSKYVIHVNSDGTLTFDSDGYPALKLKSCTAADEPARPVAVRADPSGKYCGKVPVILDMSLTFNGDGTLDFYNNVKVAKQVIDCKAEKYRLFTEIDCFKQIF